MASPDRPSAERGPGRDIEALHGLISAAAKKASGTERPSDLDLQRAKHNFLLNASFILGERRALKSVDAVAKGLRDPRKQDVINERLEILQAQARERASAGLEPNTRDEIVSAIQSTFFPKPKIPKFAQTPQVEPNIEEVVDSIPSAHEDTKRQSPDEELARIVIDRYFHSTGEEPTEAEMQEALRIVEEKKELTRLLVHERIDKSTHITLAQDESLAPERARELSERSYLNMFKNITDTDIEHVDDIADIVVDAVLRDPIGVNERVDAHFPINNFDTKRGRLLSQRHIILASLINVAILDDPTKRLAIDTRLAQQVAEALESRTGGNSLTEYARNEIQLHLKAGEMEAEVMARRRLAMEGVANPTSDVLHPVKEELLTKRTATLAEIADVDTTNIVEATAAFLAKAYSEPLALADKIEKVSPSNIATINSILEVAISQANGIEPQARSTKDPSIEDATPGTEVATTDEQRKEAEKVEVDPDERLLTAFQVLDLVHEAPDKNPTLFDTAAEFARQHGLPVNERTLETLVQIKTGTLTADRIRVGMAMLDEIKSHPDNQSRQAEFDALGAFLHGQLQHAEIMEANTQAAEAEIVPTERPRGHIIEMGNKKLVFFPQEGGDAYDVAVIDSPSGPESIGFLKGAKYEMAQTADGRPLLVFQVVQPDGRKVIHTVDIDGNTTIPSQEQALALRKDNLPEQAQWPAGSMEAQITADEALSNKEWAAEMNKRFVSPHYAKEGDNIIQVGTRIQIGDTVFFNFNTDDDLHVVIKSGNRTTKHHFPDARLRFTADSRRQAYLTSAEGNQNDPAILGEVDLYTGAFRFSSTEVALSDAIKQNAVEKVSNSPAVVPQKINGEIVSSQQYDINNINKWWERVAVPPRPVRPPTPEFYPPNRSIASERLHRWFGAPLNATSPFDQPTLGDHLRRSARSAKHALRHLDRVLNERERGPKQGFADERLLRREGYLMDPNPAAESRRKRIELAEFAGIPVGTRPDIGAWLIGPPESNKTVTMKNALMKYTESAVVISSKADFIDTIRARAQMGYVEIIAPFGFGLKPEDEARIQAEMAPYIRTYSPLSIADTWAGAQFAATSMVESSQHDPDVRAAVAKSQEAGYWNKEGEIPLAGALLLINQAKLPFEEVLKIGAELNIPAPGGKRGEPKKYVGVEKLLTLQAHLLVEATTALEHAKTEDEYVDLAKKKKDLERAVEGIRAFAAKEDRARSSVAGVLNTILHTYNRDKLRDDAMTSEVDPTRLSKERGTVYIFGTSNDMRYAGIVAADLVKYVTYATKQQQRIGPDNRHYGSEISTAIFADEVGQLPRLPISDMNESRLGVPYILGSQHVEIIQGIYGPFDVLTSVADGMVFRGTKITKDLQEKTGTFNQPDHSGDYGFSDTAPINPFASDATKRRKQANRTENRRKKHTTVPKLGQDFINGVDPSAKPMDQLSPDQAIFIGKGGLVAVVDITPYYKDPDIAELTYRPEIPRIDEPLALPSAQRPVALEPGKQVALPARTATNTPNELTQVDGIDLDEGPELDDGPGLER